MALAMDPEQSDALAVNEWHIAALWQLISAETSLGNFAAVEELVDIFDHS